MLKNQFASKVKYNFGVWAAVGLLMAGQAFAAEDLYVNLVAVNASDQAKVVPVKYYLPEELEPDDIVETGVLTLDYDVDKGSFFVRGDIQFQPKETKTFKIKVKDIWFIEKSEVDVLKKQIEQNLEILAGTEQFKGAKIRKDQLVERVDAIFAKQNSYSANINRRIEEYRSYLAELEEIRRNVFSLDYLELEAKYQPEERQNEIKFKISVQNPSADEEKTVMHKHYLPEEIREEQVLNSAGFDVRFDEAKDRSFLSKKETFAPAETKNYEVILKDIWYIDKGKLDVIEDRANQFKVGLEDSIYSESVNYLFNKLSKKLTQIRESQRRRDPIKQHIGIFRLNSKRFKEAEEILDLMEKMMAFLTSKKLEDLEKGKVKNVLQKLRALRGLAQLSEALFKKGISVTQTWRIIIGTLIFISVFTGWHFLVWNKRSKNMGEELGPKPGEGLTVVPKPGDEVEEEDEED